MRSSSTICIDYDTYADPGSYHKFSHWIPPTYRLLFTDREENIEVDEHEDYLLHHIRLHMLILSYRISDTRHQPRKMMSDDKNSW